MWLPVGDTLGRPRPKEYARTMIDYRLHAALGLALILFSGCYRSHELDGGVRRDTGTPMTDAGPFDTMPPVRDSGRRDTGLVDTGVIPSTARLAATRVCRTSSGSASSPFRPLGHPQTCRSEPGGDSRASRPTRAG